MNQECSGCQNPVPEIGRGIGIQLDSGKVFCWNCALEGCTQAIGNAVQRGVEF